ncbi:hypothetical protein GGP89_003551 [Salinibacter ruber]|uniref:Uncharacterized protein n=1 Tax=Salinibacter ruber TaxID=146919 RepID=A0A9X2ZPI2_9BACT|nr:hypothetical protein [Salinibacter ruber]MCS3866966.1 hypothetical protein [Salinibacter ruber]
MIWFSGRLQQDCHSLVALEQLLDLLVIDLGSRW